MIRYPVVSPGYIEVITGIASVLAYGAKGDGTTNDLPAINACLAANAGGTVLIPGGYNFLINGTICIPSNTTVLVYGTITQTAGTAVPILANSTPTAGYTGVVWAFVLLGNSSVVATTSCMAIPPGACALVSLTTQGQGVPGYMAGITASGSATVQITLGYGGN
jgi:Pectate lyase superfamily protein